MECLTIKELLSATRIYDQWCAKKVQRINRILRNFYLDTIDISQNIVAQEFSGTWQIIITTIDPIYKIQWFFWEWSWPCFIDQSSRCTPWCSTKQLKMSRADSCPKEWQYYIADCNTIQTNIVCNVKNWYIVYSNWPQQIESINDKICIDSYMRTWLEYFIEAFYERDAGEANRMGNSERLYKERIEKARKASDTRTFSIGSWFSNDTSVFYWTLSRQI